MDTLFLVSYHDSLKYFQGWPIRVSKQCPAEPYFLPSNIKDCKFGDCNFKDYKFGGKVSGRELA